MYSNNSNPGLFVGTWSTLPLESKHEVMTIVWKPKRSRIHLGPKSLVPPAKRSRSFWPVPFWSLSLATLSCVDKSNAVLRWCIEKSCEPRMKHKLQTFKSWQPTCSQLEWILRIMYRSEFTGIWISESPVHWYPQFLWDPPGLTSTNFRAYAVMRDPEKTARFRSREREPLPWRLEDWCQDVSRWSLKPLGTSMNYCSKYCILNILSLILFLPIITCYYIDLHSITIYYIINPDKYQPLDASFWQCDEARQLARTGNWTVMNRHQLTLRLTNFEWDCW